MSKVIIETSARHVHLKREDVETLFGKGYVLTNKKELSQPGQFACEEKVTIQGSRGSVKASILGPERPASQAEISLTDARAIGIDALIRESGDVAGTSGCTLIGPAGQVQLSEGVIAAKRHLHITPEDAAAFGVKDKEIISIDIETDARSTSFGDVVVRVNKDFATAVHIDTDEANAAGIAGQVKGTVNI